MRFILGALLTVMTLPSVGGLLCTEGRTNLDSSVSFQVSRHDFTILSGGIEEYQVCDAYSRVYDNRYYPDATWGSRYIKIDELSPNGLTLNLARAAPAENGNFVLEPPPKENLILQILREQWENGSPRQVISPDSETPWIRTVPDTSVDESGRRGKLELSGEFLTEASPDFMMFPIYGIDLSFDMEHAYLPFLWTDIGDGDWLSLYLDDEMIWESSNQAFVENELYFAEIDAHLLEGSHSLLTFYLNSVGESNASVLLVEDYIFLDEPVSVPEPKISYLVLFGILSLIIFRLMARDNQRAQETVRTLYTGLMRRI